MRFISDSPVDFKIRPWRRIPRFNVEPETLAIVRDLIQNFEQGIQDKFEQDPLNFAEQYL